MPQNIFKVTSWEIGSGEKSSPDDGQHTTMTATLTGFKESIDQE
jgi:hypothetical protein